MSNTLLDILLVEDNPGDADLVRDQLTDLPAVTCRVHHVSRLSEALLLLSTVHCNVVLLDLSLPDTQGIATLRAMQIASPDMPIVVLTGLNDDEVAQDYLVKGEMHGPGLGRALQYAMQRKQAKDALFQVNAHLTRRIDALERQQREMQLLSDMIDLLQVSHTLAEASHIIAQCVQQLFPTASGAIYMLNTNLALLESVAVWGSILPGASAFSPQACWALRRGRSHIVQSRQAGLPCAHMTGHAAWSSSLCLLLTATGSMLHVVFPPEEAQGTSPECRAATVQLALTLGDHVSLALSNLTLRQTLQEQSVRDPLTTLFNRRYMEESLHRELHSAARRSTPLGVILLDIDHFKQYNDTFGHPEGDILLRGLGTVLKTRIREEDIACRFGGEEFVLILPGAPLEITYQRAELLREIVKALPIPSPDPRLPTITLSAGVAAFPEHGSTSEDLLRAADTALYRAKAAGRDRVVAASRALMPLEPAGSAHAKIAQESLMSAAVAVPREEGANDCMGLALGRCRE